MSDEMVRNLKKSSAWFRVLFMVGFAIALYVTGVILLVLMLAQIIFSLLTGEDNINLRRLGAGLASYVSQILTFLTYNSDQKPFPFLPFPLEPTDTGTSAYTDEGVEPAVVEPVVVEPVVDEPIVVAPVVVETAAADQQAVADDDGFQNPAGTADTPVRTVSSRKNKIIDAEAPQADD